MYKIIKKEVLSDNIVSLDIQAPRIAESAKPGQFVIVIPDEKGERIPLTICDYDLDTGTVQIVVQILGLSSLKLSEMEEGDYVYSIVGPLGQHSGYLDENIDEVKKRNYVFVAGGLGTAPIYPQVRWLKERGVNVDVIIGAQNRDRVILEEKLGSVADNLYVCTDDGSYGFHGLVTDQLKDLVENQGKEYDQCVAIGPMVMMKFTALLAEELGIDTTVSLNPIMVDGTGMCGACRVEVGEETKFACVDGPEFDASLVDFDGAMQRQRQYLVEEEAACNLGGKNG